MMEFCKDANKINSEVEKSIINFAKGREKIIGVSRGNCPESGGRLYYLLTDVEKYHYCLEDEITELDIDLSHKHSGIFDICRYSYKEKDNELFLGEVIWER